MNIVVLFGVKGSGKDTIGDLLVAHDGFTKDAFANPLKQMVKLAFPRFTDEDLWGPSEKRERQEPAYPIGGHCLRCNGVLQHAVREVASGNESDLLCSLCGDRYPRNVNARIALQTLGTEWGRRLYPTIWVDSFFDRVDNDPQRYVVTDGRFRNELTRCKERGAFCVKLTRGIEESTSQHQSEAEFRSIPDSEFHYVLDNASIPLVQMDRACNILVSASIDYACRRG